MFKAQGRDALRCPSNSQPPKHHTRLRRGRGENRSCALLQPAFIGALIALLGVRDCAIAISFLTRLSLY